MIHEIDEIYIDFSESDASSSASLGSLSETPAEEIHLVNFLVPSLANCVSVSVRITSGKEYWHRGECTRTTSVTLRLHPSLPPLTTRTCSYSLEPDYQFATDLTISDLSFDGTIPTLVVEDVFPEGRTEIYGTSHISMQQGRLEKDAFVVHDDSWIPIESPYSRLVCGKLLFSLSFGFSPPIPEQVIPEAVVPEAVVAVDTDPIQIEMRHIASQTLPLKRREEETQTDEFIPEAPQEFDFDKANDSFDFSSIATVRAVIPIDVKDKDVAEKEFNITDESDDSEDDVLRQTRVLNRNHYMDLDYEDLVQGKSRVYAKYADFGWTYSVEEISATTSGG
jgi:hypothetical protein